MAAPRKIFRIEETAAARIPRKLNAATIAPSHMPAPPAAEPDIAGIADELAIVIRDTSQATQKILAAAEEIDQLADALAAALKNGMERDAAADITEILLRVFEACNFQDLTGQRIARVLKALKPHDAAIDGEGALYLHGPRRDDDEGHMSQAEIDVLFGG